MPVKFARVDPKPVPLPPTTYAITGLSKQQAAWLLEAVATRLRAVDNSSYEAIREEAAFLRRLAAVMSGVQ